MSVVVRKKSGASAPKSIIFDNAKGKNSTAAGSAVTKVTFGSVTVKAKTPTKVSTTRNVVFGQQALTRATSKMLKPGVTLHQGPGVPVFHADPTTPGKIIRELNGNCESGFFVNGKFQPG